MPALYYVRHGLTDWNQQGRLQGHRDTSLNERGRKQAVRCGEILGALFARAGRDAADYGYVSSPLMRARTTMELMRGALALPPEGYDVDAREHNKWLFRPPGGETYEEVAARVGAWYATLEKDTVVSAHGGTARAMIAFLGIAKPDEAVHHSVDQGVVYVFADRSIGRYA